MPILFSNCSRLISEKSKIFLNSSDALKAQVYGSNDGKLRLTTNGSTIALTLDESQNATFAGTLTTASTIKVDPASGDAIVQMEGAGGAQILRIDQNSKL